MQAILSYDQSGITYTSTFTLLAIRGMDEPDSLRKNAVMHEYLSGGIEEQVDGFFKDPITLTFQAVTTQLSRRFLAQWFIASTKRVIYGTYIAEGVTDETLISEWLFECEHNRSFEVKLWDEHKYYAYEDGTIRDSDMYYSAIVEITGTAGSPQTFTTNTNPAVDIWGNAFPNFTGMKASIIGTPANSSQFVFCLVGEATLTAGNLTWQAFMSEFDIPASDGKFWVKFTISAQTTT